MLVMVFSRSDAERQVHRARMPYQSGTAPADPCQKKKTPDDIPCTFSSHDPPRPGETLAGSA